MQEDIATYTFINYITWVIKIGQSLNSKIDELSRAEWSLKLESKFMHEKNDWGIPAEFRSKERDEK